MYLRGLSYVLALLAFLILSPLTGMAAQSTVQSGQNVSARLITAEESVAPDARTLSAGLVIDLAPGWKTYWRSPGEVGLPPEVLWDGSDNIASVELLYPAPHRFTAFEIENFGYETSVTFPLQIALRDPGAAVRLNAEVTLLVCADICIPETVSLQLDLPPAQEAKIDQAAAKTLAAAAALVPEMAQNAGLLELKAYLSAERLIIDARRDRPFERADVFPEAGTATFGKPDIRLSDGGRALWASLPVLYLPEDDIDLSVTLTDGAWAVTTKAQMSSVPLSPPAGQGLLWTAMIAVLGGLLLNVMPCVLPVLSLKLGHALETASAGPARIRAGFLASAAGILSFMWGLAAVIVVLQSMGTMVGWGVQFQSPAFLSAMIVLMLLFAANMAGLFEINLPEWAQLRLGESRQAPPLARGQTEHQQPGMARDLAGDFVTGAFAAVMATPCSAPFLGTAVAFALAGRALDVVVIFTALGLGLALPYILLAARPGWVAALPRPGRWMIWVKWALSALLGATAIWLLMVLWSAAGTRAALAMAGIAGLLLIALTRPSTLQRLGLSGVVVSLLLAAAALVLPTMLSAPPQSIARAGWTTFDAGRIPQEIAAGRVVFVDITADWCLTCKANKALVLNRDPVAKWLASPEILTMQGDWTRPDPQIQTYLNSFGRFGIPFNVVYGPSAPQGIPLPELLTNSAVQDALDAAR